MLKDQVTGSLAKQASGFLGESEGNITSALGGAFPAILGSVIGKASEPKGASGLMDMIGGLDMGMLGNIGGLFGGGASNVNGLLNSGGGIIESLLGDKVGGIVSMISKISGLKSGSSSSLLKMAAPFLMGMIGKQIKGKGLGFLTDMLMGQKDHVAKAMPSGMGNLLGLGFADLGDKMKGAANAATGAVTGAASAATGAVTGAANAATGAARGAANAAGNVVSGAGSVATGAARGAANVAGNVGSAATGAAKSGLGWLKVALPLLILGGLAYYFLSGGKSPVDAATSAVGNVADKAKDVAGDAATATGDVLGKAGDAVTGIASAAFSKVDEVAKKALSSVKFAAGSAGSQMMSFIDGGFKGDGKVTFKNLTFASGSDQIQGTSGVEIDNLAAILKAYPGVSIDVAGYTDSQGDAGKNQTLSENRAKTVKQRLMDKGIAPARVNTKGFGAANPVASNDTAEGRAQNRRIEVTIAK